MLDAKVVPLDERVLHSACSICTSMLAFEAVGGTVSCVQCEASAATTCDWTVQRSVRLSESQCSSTDGMDGVTREQLVA